MAGLKRTGSLTSGSLFIMLLLSVTGGRFPRGRLRADANTKIGVCVQKRSDGCQVLVGEIPFSML